MRSDKKRTDEYLQQASTEAAASAASSGETCGAVSEETCRVSPDATHESCDPASGTGVKSPRLYTPSDPLEKKEHAFWDTQPVPKASSKQLVTVCGPVETNCDVDNVPKNPLPLPESFEWVVCDINDDKELEEIYTLLNQNYVEDDDNMFRFDYSQSFLRWALGPPDFVKDWHVGVRTKKGKLVACITAVPATISVHGKAMKMVEINFLCIHKKLRSKRLAPVLIREVTRRVQLKGIWFAAYTAGIHLTRPIADCTYFHRSLNIKKLVEIRFTSLGPRTTMSMAKKLYSLPETMQTPNMRMMEEKDVPQVVALLQNQLEANTHVYPKFTHEEAVHMLLPREGVVVSYVRCTDGSVTDFFTFYILPSSVIGSEKYKTLKAAYSFYTVARTVSLSVLMTDALIAARDQDMDVFNALDINDNAAFIRELKFGRGDGSLKYYLYNYLCPPMEANKVGLIML